MRRGGRGVDCSQIERQLHVARLLMKLCIQSSGTMGKVNKIDVASREREADKETGRGANELDDKMEIVQGSEKRTKPRRCR